jgi:hypothetical protein
MGVRGGTPVQAGGRAHARLGPSSSSRWLRCPGSVNFLEDEEVDETGSIPAAHGTILHSFMEDCLRDTLDPFDFAGETREHDDHKLTLTDELAEMLLDGLDKIDTLPGKLFIERRVNLDRWMPGQFGTLDVGIAGKRMIHIWDHKFGFNPVNAVENEQLMIYALGFWDNIARHITDAKKFRLHVFQPRIPNGGGEWDVTLDELLVFGKEVKVKAAATYGKNAPRIPGPKQCGYCDGAKTLRCKEYADYNLAILFDEFDDLDDRMKMGVSPRLPKPSALTPERRSYILEHRGMFEKFLDRLHADTLDDALKGLPTPGLKAVNGKNPPRKWKGEEVPTAILSKALGDEAYTRKILSPTQAEKQLPPKIYAKLEEHVDKGKPNPTLAPEADARPALRNILDEFEDLD